MVNTVKDNRRNSTNNDYLRAIRARELQVTIGRPSDKDFIKILKASCLPNCPVTPRDVIIANKLFGPDVRALKGTQGQNDMTEPSYRRLTHTSRHHFYIEVLRGSDPVCRPYVRQ